MNPKLTRRRFIKGVIASGAAATSTAAWYSASGQERPSGFVERLVRINVNGQVRNVDVEPQETLASTLRYKLGLTGTKLGCNRGECGACTVLVDDVTTYACSVLTHSMKNGRIETVEGLIEPFLRTLACVDRAVLFILHGPDLRNPKKRGPFQRVPVMAVAAADRLG